MSIFQLFFEVTMMCNKCFVTSDVMVQRPEVQAVVPLAINRGTLTLILIILTIRMCCLGKGRMLNPFFTETSFVLYSGYY